MAARDLLAGQMQSYWAEFARNGAPENGGDKSQIYWSPRTKAQTIIFDTARGGGVRMIEERSTFEDIARHIAQDPRFESDAERCNLISTLDGIAFQPLDAPADTYSDLSQAARIGMRRLIKLFAPSRPKKGRVIYHIHPFARQTARQE